MTNQFERDYNWYLKYKDDFNFDGAKDYVRKYIRITTFNNEDDSISNVKEYALKTFESAFDIKKFPHISKGMFSSHYFELRIENVVVPDENGASAKECFWLWDSQGRVEPCREPELFKAILKCKGSINLNIKMWAQGINEGSTPKFEFEETIMKEFELPDWVKVAVYNQVDLIRYGN